MSKFQLSTTLLLCCICVDSIRAEADLSSIHSDVSNADTAICLADRQTISGTLTGLAPGNTLVLKNNDSDHIIVADNGLFEFPNKLISGSPFNVEVAAGPNHPNQTCHVENASGLLSADNRSNVSIHCTTDTLSVGGSAFGLKDGSQIVLQINKNEQLELSSDGYFIFETELPDESIYFVTVLNQPEMQYCQVSNGKGRISGREIRNVGVQCTSENIAAAPTPSPGAGMPEILSTEGVLARH